MAGKTLGVIDVLERGKELDAQRLAPSGREGLIENNARAPGDIFKERSRLRFEAEQNVTTVGRGANHQIGTRSALDLPAER